MKNVRYRSLLRLQVFRTARSRIPGAFRLLLGASVAGTLLSACASVAPYEKEHLGDPILALDAETAEEAREVKWLEAREGSTGGVGGAGGGCACN